MTFAAIVCVLRFKAWFSYDHWRSFTAAGIPGKLFSDCNDHMETKFSFCQRSLMIPATAKDHDHWDRIRVYLRDHSNRERSSAITTSYGNHQYSNRNDRNNPSDHMEIIAQGSQRSYVSCDLNDPSDYMEINLQRPWRSQRSNVFSDFSDLNDPSDHNDSQRSYENQA